MKTISLLIAIIVFANAYAQDGNYKINTSKSVIAWTGKKVTGQHTGNLSLKSGELVMKKGKITGGTFEIDMKSMTNTDIKDAGMNQKLIGHLKSEDFFSVDKYPVARLVITRSTTTDGLNYDITGDLTIKGKTLPVNYKAIVTKNGSQAVAKASITVDRAKYDVRYGSKSFFEGLGDNLIYDEFLVDVTLEFEMK